MVYFPTNLSYKSTIHVGFHMPVPWMGFRITKLSKFGSELPIFPFSRGPAGSILI